ncbi:hypothetical protein Scep_025539 [Stephania cephalantha]|uniref:Uncharacterized protein n=1 Tax=Stephania cephalantha TaxID=152367 RepID=A0AAP0EKY7_9MAGN
MQAEEAHVGDAVNLSRGRKIQLISDSAYATYDLEGSEVAWGEFLREATMETNLAVRPKA